MKTILFKQAAKAFTIFCAIAFITVTAAAQAFVNNIDIGSAQQTVNPTTTYNPWQVTALSTGMQNSWCSGNTTTNVAPPTGSPVSPVINQAAQVVTPFPGWPSGTWLSCYQYNTIYTPMPTVDNDTNCTMTIRRSFKVCSNQNEQVTFDFYVTCDNTVLSVDIDAGTGGAISLFTTATPYYTLPTPLHIGATTQTLAPGLHTIDIKCGDYEQIGGSYYTIAGMQKMWNPFGVKITGSVSTTGNVLLNTAVPAVAPITGAANLCAGNTITLADATPGGTWASTNTGVATIDASGVVTGVAPGTTTISYTITNGQCTNAATVDLTVDNCHCEDSCNWSLTGNTNVKTWNFIGSLNNADFKIRTNNTQRMLVTAAGNVGINTTAPAKLLEVNGEARIGLLPAAAANDRVVFANASGDLRSLTASGNTNEYLSGNGTWQTITGGGGTITADQGLTMDNNTVLLGDVCNAGGGQFAQSREINMNSRNLYFNSSSIGKLYMGDTQTGADECRPLYTRLEISSAGLRAYNDYYSPLPSTSGLRFTDLTAKETPIDNKYGGVLSLDTDGDVIWVKSCCKDGIGPEELKNILDRLDKLESEVKESKAQTVALKTQLAQMDVVLSKTNTIILDQNVPNPFAQSTVITYAIPSSFKTAQMIFRTMNGELIKTVDIKSAGKGQLNIFAGDISSGAYTYTLVVDGKQIETKRMVKMQ
jgi:hypothetical protein